MRRMVWKWSWPGFTEKVDEHPENFILSINDLRRMRTTKVKVPLPRYPRTSTRIRKVLMSIEERRVVKGRKNQRGGESKKGKNRRIKEILILSESVLIFSSGLAMCTLPVISSKTKKGRMWREIVWVCVRVYSLCGCSGHMFIFTSALKFVFPRRYNHVCMKLVCVQGSAVEWACELAGCGSTGWLEIVGLGGD